MSPDSILYALSLLFFAFAVVAALVNIIQALMTWWWVRQGPKLISTLPGISVLKPLCGIDDDLERNLEHFATLDYPNYEVLLGVKNEKDPAYPVAVAAVRRWPNRFKLFLQRGEPGLNPKVNQLVTLEAEARHELLLVSDSNCRTPKGYLHEIAAEFEDPQVACVTNPIVGIGEQKMGSLLDNFHLGSSVGPGMIAAKLAPLPHDIVVGKSMALRRSALQALGGFHSARNHLAEDYVLGRGIHDVVKMKVAHCKLPVFQVSQAKTLKDFAARHKRWCVIQRTAIRGHTYFGYGLTALTPWALIGFVLHPTAWTALGFLGAWGVKSACDASNTSQFRGRLFGWKTPLYALLKDLVWSYTWAYGAFVRTVNWRGNKLRVHYGSQLIPPDGFLPQPVQTPAALPIAMQPIPTMERGERFEHQRVA